MGARNTAVLLGVRIDRKSLADATADALAAVEQGTPPIVFACANPHALVTAQTDGVFRSALNNASIIVADGVGVTLMARVARVKIGPRITGSDYFLSVMRSLSAQPGRRVFFFGSSSEVIERIAGRIEREFPSLTLCGTLCPPYRPWSADENRTMIASINSATPDVLWVGMTAPKQEKWVEENRHQLRVPVIGSVGAVFDYYAGMHPRAPRWVCSAGFEWAYRLAREPRRMWRRTFVSAPKFVALVLWLHMRRAGKQ